MNLYTENKSKDQNNYSTEENNHNSKSLKQEKNDINEYLNANNSNIIYLNIDEMINNEKSSDNKNYDKNNGKKIITTNEMITNKFQEYFKNKRINVDNLKEM